MNKTKILILGVLLCVFTSAAAQEYSWKAVEMDGSRTGCTTPDKDNVPEAAGVIKGGKYYAPNGEVFKAGSSAAKAAAVVIDAQPAMASVKEVIGYSPVAMSTHRPESALSNWAVDIIIDKVARLTGKEVHMGVTNFGGIRANMPEGNILLDDMKSMFPFKNYVVYVEHKGSTIRKMFEKMANGHFQVLGGVSIVVENGKLVKAEVGGKPLDDNKTYGIATISFLLDGGDGLAFRNGALELIEFPEVDIIDAVLEHVYAETAAGRPIEYKEDGRIVIK